jgi:hypothetical protein
MKTKTKTRLVTILVESERGHDEFKVPEDEVQKEVETQLNNNRWVTLEHQDGSSELLTKKDIPNADLVNEDDEESVEESDDRDEEDIEADEDAKDQELLDGFKKDTGKAKPLSQSAAKKSKGTPVGTTPTVKEEWSSKFEDITSACVTAPAKGG